MKSKRKINAVNVFYTLRNSNLLYQELGVSIGFDKTSLISGHHGYRI